MTDAVVCVDFGSTFTKAALVDLAAGRIVASASHPTTIGTDVLDGYDACLIALAEQDPRAEGAEVLACSSAGGGLRIAPERAEHHAFEPPHAVDRDGARRRPERGHDAREQAIALLPAAAGDPERHLGALAIGGRTF